MGKKKAITGKEFMEYIFIKLELEDIEKMAYSLNQKIFEDSGILSRFDVQFIELGDAMNKLFKSIREMERKHESMVGPYEEVLSRIARECEEEKRERKNEKI